VLIIGLIITYLIFVGNSIHYVTPSLLSRMDWGKVWWALPVVFTAFGYQSIIPTLFNYMNRSVFKVRLALICGTTIPLLLYVIWEFLIVGIVPLEGKRGLMEALTHGNDAVIPLGNYIHNPGLLNLGKSIAFFAMTTSFLGISIAFVDFLLDGLNLSRKRNSKVLIWAAVFLIPLLIAFINPYLFIYALNVAGGISIALLLGAMPILMVWAGRYCEGYSLMHQQLPGGKMTLFLMLLFIIAELGIAIFR
jgi:tyrosine-specific transport protein